MTSSSDGKHPLGSKKDQAYIKEYIESHPDNRMAWYLLGKQYERNGEQGKANYCFKEAGDIYHAFENVPRLSEEIEELAENTERQQAASHISRNGKKRIGIAILLFLLLGSIAGEVKAPSRMYPASVESEAGEAKDDAISKKTDVHLPNGALSIPSQAGILVPEQDDAAFGHALKDAKHIVSKVNHVHYLLHIRTHQQWWMWKAPLRPDYRLSADSNGQNIVVTPLQGKQCKCDADRVQASSFVQQWMPRSVERLVAKSALTAVLQMNDQAPKQWSKLASKYPNNVVSGITPQIAQAYDEIAASYMSHMKKAKQIAPKKAKQQALQNIWSDESDPFREPMRILVDRKHHRLAVVSGKIMLRNYKVGLGGKRTPLGSFRITEKVVDPNGSSIGDFGSRGMTLSDTLYAIHGTNEPDSIGLDKSLGCVRMSKEDVEELFDMVPIGTEVVIGSDILPEELLVPDKDSRYRLNLSPKQDNPNKRYRWL
ncbi:L,D-transpeptidase [Paenibacillus alvei]|uniref:L,D-transpeptidase n=1 Tax=Paenibacillus alvei TaxID=44250 RepID=UPI0013D96116|nr:L,D-transpeptidase [Paenibacillus alvei]NEZ42714.1 L,D-transpeptidase family protein [Paenibacillus alvei]